MWLRSFRRPEMPQAGEALPGSPTYRFTVPQFNEVLGTSMHDPLPAGIARMYLGMGCFWGAEKRLWQLPGVFTTAVGYQGGYTPYPTYEEVSTGMTGHCEIAMVAYSPESITTLDVLRMFWENHDPTQGFQQGNDIGTQYRSAIYWTTHEQRDLAERTRRAYSEVLAAEGFDPISTEIEPAMDDGGVIRPFYFAEAYHQQYLFKVPHGYDCHAHTGIMLPDIDR